MTLSLPEAGLRKVHTQPDDASAMDDVHRLGSSLRIRPPARTLALAIEMAKGLGITRVTDITRLDNVGVPVCASIRPTAATLCVNAGKGLTLLDAQVGAYMESIEYALAEFGKSPVVEYKQGTPCDILDGTTRPDAVLDFCPIKQRKIRLKSPLGCVRANDLASGESVWVPAELVFLPCPAAISLQSCFGYNSNGLASGNSVDEATLHGAFECFERDIRSFQHLHDTSRKVCPDSYPASIKQIDNQITQAGLSLSVRYAANEFDLPYFMAVVADQVNPDPLFVNAGFGCHFSRDIAISRAVTEALQSRLSYIHGGRDDLFESHQYFSKMNTTERLDYGNRLIKQYFRSDRCIRFDETPDAQHQTGSIRIALDAIMQLLARINGARVLRVIYTEPSQPLQVVRVLITHFEYFTGSSPRVGHRLRDYVQRLA